jgi:hypothetical protein
MEDLILIVAFTARSQHSMNGALITLTVDGGIQDLLIQKNYWKFNVWFEVIQQCQWSI